MKSRTSTARWRTGCAAALMLLTLAACADDAPPSQSAPALSDSLEEVDAAIEAGQLEDARRAVEELIEETAQARVDGDISDEQADQIFDAAQEVLDRLPGSDEG